MDRPVIEPAPKQVERSKFLLGCVYFEILQDDNSACLSCLFSLRFSSQAYGSLCAYSPTLGNWQNLCIIRKDGQKDTDGNKTFTGNNRAKKKEPS